MLRVQAFSSQPDLGLVESWLSCLLVLMQMQMQCGATRAPVTGQPVFIAALLPVPCCLCCPEAPAPNSPALSTFFPRQWGPFGPLLTSHFCQL